MGKDFSYSKCNNTIHNFKKRYYKEQFEDIWIQYGHENQVTILYRHIAIVNLLHKCQIIQTICIAIILTLYTDGLT